MLRQLADIALRGLLVLVILVAVNLLAGRFHGRWDLTENNDYTLSPSTRSVLDRLDDVINVTVYFSRDLPSYFASLDRQVTDLMDEYAAAGRGNLQVSFVDPSADPITEQSVLQLGIPKRPVTIYQGERAEAQNVFLGIAVQHADQTEVLPWVEDVTRLEYELTSAVVKVSEEERPVGIAAPGGTVPQNLAGVQAIVGNQYPVEPVDLAAGPVDPSIRTLIVVDAPQWDETARYHLDQYLMRGGRAMVAAHGVNVNLAQLTAQPSPPTLGGLLARYGVLVSSDLVVDGQCPRVAFDTGGFLPLSVRYPWFPQVVESGFSQDNPITSRLQSLVLPWTSSLRTVAVDSTGGAAVTTTVLAQSSERSYSSTGPFQLNPQIQPTLPAEGVGPQTLAVVVSGRLPSAWRGRNAPGDSLGVNPPGPDTGAETHLVVVGTSRFLETQFLQQYPGNALFLANAVDWMNLGDDLIAIRSRASVDRPLEQIEDDRKTLYKNLATFGVPVLVVLFGLGRWRWRRNRRQRLAAQYGGAS